MAPGGQISADGAARRHADDAHRIRRFLRATATGRAEVLVLGPAPNTAPIRKATGIDPTGFLLILESNHARHALVRHGDPRTEAQRGRAALEAADLALLPAILCTPDAVRAGEVRRRGAPTAVFVRRMGKADDVVVTELRLMARIITFKTMLKRPIRSTKKMPRGTPMPAPEDTPQEFTAAPGLRAEPHISPPIRLVQADTHRHRNKTGTRLRSHARTPSASAPCRQRPRPA